MPKHLKDPKNTLRFSGAKAEWVTVCAAMTGVALRILIMIVYSE